jgi:hypothetical protein
MMEELEWNQGRGQIFQTPISAAVPVPEPSGDVVV